MNVLPIEKRAQILHLPAEDNSTHATSRLADVSINTVTKLLVDARTACIAFQDEIRRARATAFSAMKSGRSASRERTSLRKTRALLDTTATHG